MVLKSWMRPSLGTNVPVFKALYSTVTDRFECYDRPNTPGRKFGVGLNAGQAQAVIFAIPEAQHEQNFLVEDEFEGLTLDITVPKHLPAGKKLPVLVVFPGGGNSTAASGIRLFG